MGNVTYYLDKIARWVDIMIHFLDKLTSNLKKIALVFIIITPSLTNHHCTLT